MNCPHCEHPCGDAAKYCEACGGSLHGGDLGLALGQAYREELGGRLEAAAAMYERLLEKNAAGARSAVVRKHLGNLHFRLGHLRLAREHLSRACELDPDNPAPFHDLGVVAYHMADFDGAVEALRRAVGTGAGLELAWFWLGNALYHRGDLDDAAEAFRELLSRYPNFTIARFHLGVIYARQGDKSRAEDEFRRVLATSPADAAARYYVAPESG